MAQRIVLLVSLFPHPGQGAGLRQFEAAAARIMARYGGRIERVLHPTDAIPSADLPYEVHVVSFPDDASFAAYRADTDLAALAPLRQASIARTAIIFATEGEPY